MCWFTMVPNTMESQPPKQVNCRKGNGSYYNCNSDLGQVLEGEADYLPLQQPVSSCSYQL